MTISPRLAIGDGALGFWAAMEGEFPNTANVLDKMAKSAQVHAKKLIQEMYMSPIKSRTSL